MIVSWKMIGLFMNMLLLITPSFSIGHEVERIDIKASYFNGFQNKKKGQTRIIRKGKDYFFCASLDEEKCDTPIVKEAVDYLVQAVALPPLEKLDVIRLGLNEEGFKARVNKSLDSNREGLEGGLFIERCEPKLCSGQLYEESFLKNYVDIKKAQRWFEYYFNSYWTDDYPSFQIKLVFDNGETWILESSDQHDLMLPWTVTRSGKTFKTYAPEIPRALHLVLPNIKLKKWPNKEEAEALKPQVYNYHRLEMDPYEFWLKELLVNPVRKDMHVHLLRQTLGTKMDFLESHFDILDLNLDAPFAWRGTWVKNETRLPLQWKFRIYKFVRFPQEKKDLNELYAMATKAEKVMRQIEGTSWFNIWWSQFRNQIVRMQINGQIWNTGESNIQNIFKVLESNKFKLLVQQWTPDQKNIESLTIVHSMTPESKIDRYSEWLVLPSGEMVLWKTNVDHIYKWNLADYGKLSDTKGYEETYHSVKINYIIRIDSKGEMIIQKPDLP